MDGVQAERNSRGMANLVGIILLIGLTLIGAIAVVVVGSAALGAVSDQTTDDTTEDSMREMSARLGGVADSSVDQATSFQMEGNVDLSSAKIRIEAQNDSTGSIPYTWERTLGSIVYEQSDGTQLAYQGGGLWRDGDGRTMIVNEPGLDYDGSTLDLSIVNISQLNSISKNGEVVARKDVTASEGIQRDVANALQDSWTTENGTVPVDMTISIESQYADGWAHYAENGMTVTPANVDLSGNTVELTFDDLGAEINASGTGGAPGGPPGGPPGGGSVFDDALRYDDDRNALQVNQAAGNLTLMTAQIGEAVEIETTVDDEYRDPMDVVFAIDETGSMRNNDRSNQRIEATRSFIDLLNDTHGDRTGYVQFSTDDQKCSIFGCGDRKYPGRSGIVGHHSVTSNHQSVKDDLAAWTHGGTNITRGIDEATKVHTNVADPNDERVMVVLTDGRNENSDTTNAATISAARRAYENHDITVYPVGLGDDVNRTLLEKVALAGNGTDYHVDNPDDLEELFGKLANETKSETVRQINRTHTSLSAQQATTTGLNVDGESNINNPDFFAESTGLSEKYDLTGLDAGQYLSFTLELESCDDYELTDVNSTDNGTDYRHTYCEDSGSTTTTIDNTTADHHVFRDGDPVSGLSALTTDWWHSDPESFLGSYTTGSQFDMGANESIIALDVPDADGQSGYVLMHFDVAEIEGGTNPPSNPSNGAPGTNAPRQPITIGYSEVGVT